MRHAVILLAMLVALIPSAVSADELWVLNEGGVEVVINSDSNWEDVTVSGEQGLIEVGPCLEPADGMTKACAVIVSDAEWLVITADNIKSWEIVVACNQSLEDVVSEVRLIVDNVADISASSSFDSNEGDTSAAQVDIEPDNDDSSNGPSIAEMNAEKAIEEYNEWFITVSWNELD